jgi:flagellar biosynthesis protein FlhB
LLAKGSDSLALKIREIAAANEILLLESPARALSICYSTELEFELEVVFFWGEQPLVDVFSRMHT